MEVYINGVSVIRVTGLLLRDKTTDSSDASGEGRIGGMHFQTFFGGALVSYLIRLPRLIHRHPSS